MIFVFLCFGEVAAIVIYKMTNMVNGKVYIGQTVRSVEERMLEHYRHDTILVDKAIQKYGKDNFSVEVIDTAATIDELNAKEQYWIEQYDSITPNGYNQCAGGDNTMGYHHREESKQKMSEAKAESYLGEGNPFYGKEHSEESKQKMSQARKGLAHLTEEQVKKLRQSHHTVRVMNVETGEIFDSVQAAANKYGLKDTHITRVCKGKRNRTGGFHWKYVDQEDE